MPSKEAQLPQSPSNQADGQVRPSVPAGGATVYEEWHAGIGRTIGFRKVTLEADFERLHAWHREPHVVPFWQLAIPADKYRAHLEAFLADSHQTLYIGMLDGEPMSYFESYWAERDVLAGAYEAEPGDQGIHLLIGPSAYLGKGYAAPLLQAMMRLQLREGGTRRLVAEPDARNAKMIHIFEQCGYAFQRHIELPDKTAALMIAARNRAEELLNR
ncbi:GNAT family N-acetyltransferase [Paenibacillus methanolicus]|uniref:Lysine N-acyltransferase MbtK n=1 Tax=Paenibacillus methanolicus TaxID=582686 RepID=A0A5S5BWD6_9BACL|nr:GNAT family N-acetyltransferase [Paenibacillus methanolicus]TYP70618.1 RimJ/RimL family protein N-acetyltransferase [Paenibacillus methanolicus]